MRRLLPILGSIVFFIISTSVLPLTHADAASGVPILTYHYIRDYNYQKDPAGNTLSVSHAVFDQQMNYLVSHGYTPITLDTMYAIFNHQAPRPAKPIVLTFDDGYIDFYANAYPILKKYNFHAVSFIVTDFVGRPAYLSWSNIKEMQASGLISFEAHTTTHAYLPTLNYQAALSELKNSKDTLQAQTGTIVNFIAYPYGASNWNVQKAASRAGFVGGAGTWGGYASSQGMNMPRIAVRNSLQSVSSRFP